MSYSFALEVCDVADRVHLIEYREKRTAWLQMLEGDPKHAVWQQIYAMLWGDAIFRMVNETRRLSHQAASYVAHDGLPYDTGPGERDYMAKVLRENQGDDVHSEWVSTTGPQAWGMAEFAHEQFDKLSGVSADHRARSDLIRDAVFHTIEHMLVEFGVEGYCQSRQQVYCPLS